MSGQSQTLYRKWRSQTFGDLVGQDAIIHTLRQAVAQGRLTHAYLFCGPRGTGKTSTARLLAKMVNCATPRDGEPCNTCSSCTEITEGRSTDVFEIDAASNRGIDEIRDLRERVRIVSGTGRTRVYIIDEVHMMTNEAFNALLKTLEEPPPRVIFILATTEQHKVPATVVSRCQPFDFRRISLRDIVAHLGTIASAEQMRVETAALEIIGRAAQGGMRDALSLLDQARAFAGDEITAEAARSMLGMADPTRVRELIEFVAMGDTAAGLHRINELAQSGIDLRQLTNQIAEIWRQLMLSRAGANVAALLDLTDEAAAEIASLSQRFTLEHLTECARIFTRQDAATRVQVIPQLALELAFLDCVAVVHQQRPVSIETAPVNSTPRSMSTTVTSAATPATVQRTAPPMPPPAPTPIRPSVTVPTEPQAEERAAAAPPPQQSAPEPSVIRETPAPPPAVTPPAPAGPTAAPVATEVYETARAQWEMIKRVSKQKKVDLPALLAVARPVSAEATTPVTVVISVDHDFHLDKLSKPDNRKWVEWAVAQVIQQPAVVRFITLSEAAAYGPPPPLPTVIPDFTFAPPPEDSLFATERPAPRADVTNTSSPPTEQPTDSAAAFTTDPRNIAHNDPVVRALEQEFGARVIDVHRDDR